MPWECGECNAKENKKTRVDAVLSSLRQALVP